MGASRSELQKFDTRIKNTASVPGKRIRISLNNEGLCCNIGKAGKNPGKKVFVTRYRMPGSAAQKELAYRPFYPAMTVSEALALHEETMKLVRAGIDPKTLDLLRAEEEAAKHSFEDIATSYFEWAGTELRPRTVTCYLGRYNRWIKERFSGKKIAEITSSQAAQLVDEVKTKAGRDCTNKGSGNRTASIVRTVLSEIFVHAISKGAILPEENPMQFVTSVATKTQQKRKKDHRSLTLDELIQAWNMLETYVEAKKMFRGKAVCCYILILTGLRVQEAIEMRWSEITLDEDGGGVYRIPTDRMKADRPHEVYLSPFAIRMLSEIRTDIDAVFASPKMPGEQASYGTPNNAFRAIFGERQPASMPRLTIPWFSPHDIRRSFATGLRRELKVAKSTIHEMIAHNKHSDDFDEELDKIYIKHSEIDDHKIVWKKWSDLIEGLVTKKVLVAAA